MLARSVRSASVRFLEILVFVRSAHCSVCYAFIISYSIKEVCELSWLLNVLSDGCYSKRYGCSMYKAMHVVLYTNPFLFQYADRLSKFQNKLTLVKILSRNP